MSAFTLCTPPTHPVAGCRVRRAPPRCPPGRWRTLAASDAVTSSWLAVGLRSAEPLVRYVIWCPRPSPFGSELGLEGFKASR